MPQQKQGKRQLESLIDRRASEWLDRQVVRLGKDSTQLIQTGKPGVLWARLSNGRPIPVHTKGANVPSRFDLHLLVGRRRSQPSVWQVITSLEDYDEPADGGELTYHHEQHEEKGGDRGNWSRKQIMARTVRVKNAAGFIVQVFGDDDLTVSGWKLIPHKIFNLSAYVPTAGARFVAIESDNNGALSVNAGTVFAAPQIATPANYPVPAVGKYPVARVLLFEGQTRLLDEHITISMPPSFNPLAFSGSGHVHVLDDLEDVNAPSPTDGQVLTWDEYAEEWIADDPLSGGDHALDDHIDVNVPAPTDGQVLTWDAYAEEWIAADPTGGEGETGEGTHLHGLARWNGASGQTTFDLPDLAFQIEALMLNGLEEDPLVYSLSSDGSQIVLDTALASNTLVMTHYVLLNL